MSAVRLALLLAAATPPGHAAPLHVSVTDAAGKPLADAVVMLEPASGKASVKPLPDVETSQAKRQFHPRVTLITVGTRVAFPNFDTVRHHVYSFSQARSFELKLYAGAPAGAYRISTWHPGLPANSAPVVQSLQLGSSEQRETVQLAVDAAP